METKPIRVLLVDDHSVVRSGLSAMLSAEDDLEQVGEAADAIAGEDGHSAAITVGGSAVIMASAPVLGLPSFWAAASRRAGSMSHSPASWKRGLAWNAAA